jgi:mediator of RNA polymerase II transcription subunit 7
LKDQGIEQFYPSEADSKSPSQPSQPLNHAYYLLKISKSLLLNFLEFVGVLSVSPEQFEAKIEDLRNLFINAHHLLNLYRPHQARESLILMMEEQLDRTREEIQQIDRVKAEIEDMLENLKAEGFDADTALESVGIDASKPTEPSEQDAGDSKLIWDLLEEKD